MTSQLFLVSSFWSHSFVSHRKWNFTFLVHQNTGEEHGYRFFLLKSLSKIFLCYTYQYIETNKKKVSHIHFKLCVKLWWPMISSYPSLQFKYMVFHIFIWTSCVLNCDGLSCNYILDLQLNHFVNFFCLIYIPLCFLKAVLQFEGDQKFPKLGWKAKSYL